MSDVERASTLIDVRRYDEAIGLLTRHLGQEPGDWRALCLLGQAQVAMDRDAEALVAAQRAAALAPNQEWPFRLQALALLGLGKARQAVPLAERSVAYGLGLWQPLHTLTGAYLAAGMKGKARGTSAQLLAVAPNEALAVLRAAEVCRAVKDTARARALTDRALALDPTSAVVHNDRAVALLQTRRHTEALQGFSTAASLDPRMSVAPRNFKAVIHHTLNRATWIAWVFAYVIGRGVADAVDQTDKGGSLLARLMCLSVAIGLPLVMLRVYRQVVTPLPAAVRRQVLEEVRQDRRMTLGLLAYGVATITYAIAAVLPEGLALDAVVTASLTLLVSRLCFVSWKISPSRGVLLALALTFSLFGAVMITASLQPDPDPQSEPVAMAAIGGILMVLGGLTGWRWRLRR